jgi:sensor histidine kinase YesM
MIMSDAVIVALLSLAGTFTGTFSGIKLISYRIEQLEKRVEKHNSLIERTYKLEEKAALHEEQIKEANHRIEDLERHEEGEH